MIIKCDKCGGELSKQGGLLFGPPVFSHCIKLLPEFPDEFPDEKNRKELLREIERYHNSGGSRSAFLRKNPYFVRRRICAICGIWPVSQSYICHGCKDILLLKIATKLGLFAEQKKKKKRRKYRKRGAQ